MPRWRAKADVGIGQNNNTMNTKYNSIALHIPHSSREFPKGCGYRVGINSPFSNSKTFPVPVKRYHSLMIEVKGEKVEGFERLHREVVGLYEKLLKKKCKGE